MAHCINCGSPDVKWQEADRPQNAFCSKVCQHEYYYPEGKETPSERYRRKKGLLDAGVSWRRVFEVTKKSGWEQGTCPSWIDPRDEQLWLEYWDRESALYDSPSPPPRRRRREREEEYGQWTTPIRKRK